MKNLYKKAEEKHPDFKAIESILKSSEQVVNEEVEKLFTEKDIFTEEVGIQTIKKVLTMALIQSSKGTLQKYEYGLSRKDSRAISKALNKVNTIIQKINID